MRQLSFTKSMFSEIIGLGHYLPPRVLTNDDMAQFVDTSDEWITQRTGIKKRHFALPEMTSSDMAFEAAKMALSHANLKPQDIDVIILATATPDETFPATATILQDKLQAKNAYGFDVSAVCSGFIVGFSVADMHIRSGMGKNILLVGAETFSRIMDMSDRSTCVLFGDGAGAVVMRASSTQHILGYDIHSDGSYHDLLYTDGGVSTTGTAGKIRMVGREVYRHAVNKLSTSATNLLAKHGLSVSDIDWFVPHQANIRIIHSVADHIGLPYDKIITTVQDHANTSAASIPLALSTAVHSGQIQKGQLVLTEAIGGGIIWGSALFRY